MPFEYASIDYKCSKCGGVIKKGERIFVDKIKHTVMHEKHYVPKKVNADSSKRIVNKAEQSTTHIRPSNPNEQENSAIKKEAVLLSKMAKEVMKEEFGIEHVQSEGEFLIAAQMLKIVYGLKWYGSA